MPRKGNFPIIQVKQMDSSEFMSKDYSADSNSEKSGRKATPNFNESPVSQA